MSRLAEPRIWIGALCAVLALSVGTSSASAAVGDPEFIYSGSSEFGFENPCGISVDPAGNFYVSSYYPNNVAIFNTSRSPLTELAEVDTEGGPCATATDNEATLFVNNYHRNVVRLAPSSPSIGSTTTYGPPVVLDSAHPTGVGVDRPGGLVYVDDRTYIAVYDVLGGAVLDEGSPLEIGHGLLEDGYGLAVSEYGETAGLVYVADAGENLVKVFNGSGALINSIGAPVGAFGGFDSLRDSAIAIDKVSGDIYVADHLGSQQTEQPETAIEVFDSTGAYQGRLQYNVIDAGPTGLAVDNSTGTNQGRVYVGSGISENGSVYAYPPGSAVAASLPASLQLSVLTAGSGSGSVTSAAAGVTCSSTCSTRVLGGTEVQLEASPDSGSRFAGWSGGGCSGTGSCVLSMSQARTIIAEFSAGPAASDEGTAAPVAANPQFQQSARALTSGPAAGKRQAKRKKQRAHRHRKAGRGGKARARGRDKYGRRQGRRRQTTRR